MDAGEAARDYIDFGTLAGVPANRLDWAATCAPSVAMALLAATRNGEAGDASGSAAARAA
jgi:hypothetical protein